MRPYLLRNCSTFLLCLGLTFLIHNGMASTQMIAQSEKRYGGSEEIYNSHIRKGDYHFSEEEYGLAAAEYEAALKIKSEDSYAKYKISQCERYKKMAEEEKQRKQDEFMFNRYMDRGNQLLREKRFREAIDTLAAAQKIKPDKSYIQLKIETARLGLKNQDSLVTRDQDRADTQLKYDEALAQADALFYDQKYEESIEEYEKAKGIKNLEQYPMLQIKQAKTLIVERDKMQAERDTWDKYNQLIEEADELLINKQYEKCIEVYEQANEVIKNQYHPRIKIITAKDLLSKKERDSIDFAYSSELVTGDEYRSRKEYEQAVEYYQKALIIKPARQYPLSKIIQCQDFIRRREAKKVKEKFDGIMEDGLDLVHAKEWKSAYKKFEEALEIYPLHTYAKTMRKLCEKEIKKEAKRNRKPVNYYELFKNPAATHTEVEGSETDITFDAGSESNRSFKELYLDQTKKRTFFKAVNDLAKKYPPGITQELKAGYRKSIIRHIVIVENEGAEYLRVEHEWGAVYYFKDGLSITKQVWEKGTGQVKPVED